MATTLRFKLKIPAIEAMRYYQGQARFVSVIAENGQRIQFPAENIRSFITRSGVEGRFAISFDDNHKLIGIEQI